jgi:hypothetical protein
MGDLADREEHEPEMKTRNSQASIHKGTRIVGPIIWIAALCYLATRATSENELPREGIDTPMTEAMGRHWRLAP